LLVITCLFLVAHVACCACHVATIIALFVQEARIVWLFFFSFYGSWNVVK
jgi:hypothetical protein